MSRTTNRIIGTLAAALAVVALSPSASMANQDLRSPDARDAASSGTMRGHDLRSPDARDAASSGTMRGQDLRSPDAIDAAQQPPVPSPSADPSGTQWPDAALVAGGAAGLVAIGLAGLAVLRQRRTVRKGRMPVVSG